MGKGREEKKVETVREEEDGEETYLFSSQS